jgi:hypothetical protein
MSTEAIGIMDPAFFVGRGELLSWANEMFSVNFKFKTNDNYLNDLSIVELDQGRIMCNWGSLLSNHRCNLPRYSQSH